MTFVTILRVTKILCSFGLVFEVKTGKKIPASSRLQFLETFLAIFCSTDAEDNTCGPFNRGGIADLSLLRTLLAIRQKSREPSFWEVMDSFVLLAYASLAASRTLLQRLLACLNFTLESEDLSFWCKWKKWFLWTMVAAQAAENHGDEWGLTWYLQWGILNPTWSNSQDSLVLAEAPSLTMCSHQTFLNDYEDHSNFLWKPSETNWHN